MLYLNNFKVIILSFSDINDCVNHKCQNGATCIDADSTYRCFCRTGFQGRYCETNINDCASMPCLHGGNCTDLINDFICKCTDGWKGKFCSSSKLYTNICFSFRDWDCGKGRGRVMGKGAVRGINFEAYAIVFQVIIT